MSMLALALVACGGAAQQPSPQPTASATAPTALPTLTATATAPRAVTASPQSPATAASTRTAAPAVTQTGVTPAPLPASPGHVFLIIMENRDATSILNNPRAPYINQLATRYASADHYYAIRHPSLPNYLALIGGDTFGVDSDCTDCFQSAPNLVDALEAKGKTWKSYQEDMPRPCFLGEGTGKYALKHDPFLYFTDVRTNPARCNRVVPLTQFDTDLTRGNVPDFTWITPNLTNDMHDGSIADGDTWLATFVPKILQSTAWKEQGELIITWDEGEGNAGCCGVATGGRVPLLVITPNGQAGYHIAPSLTHYNLLRTIEDHWGLARIGHSGDANVQSFPDLARGG
ncbi:MAG: alkaline phosphatase family protein [Chloroflexota bacterium]|nr:alkaline phosphatase family protein [Chloroflexota bacterium]